MLLQRHLTELSPSMRPSFLMVDFSFLQKHGLVIIPDGTPNGDVNHEPMVGAITVVSQEAAQVLESAGEGPLGKTLLLCPGLMLLGFQLVHILTWKIKTA
jgi:hypothetical protein